MGCTLTVYVSAGQPVNAHQSGHSVVYREYLQERWSQHCGQRPDPRLHFVQLLHVLAMTSLLLKLDPKPSDAVSSTVLPRYPSGVVLVRLVLVLKPLSRPFLSVVVSSAFFFVYRPPKQFYKGLSLNHSHAIISGSCVSLRLEGLRSIKMFKKKSLKDTLLKIDIAV